MERFRRRITKSGTVFAVTIPRDAASRLGIGKGSFVFVEIKLNDTVLYQGMKKVTVIGKMLAVVLPKGKAFDRIWNILYSRDTLLDVSVATVDEVIAKFTSS